MAVSAAVRKKVMKAADGLCQFWHTEPVKATEISHRVHQGIGGLLSSHVLNQPGNVEASCSACHARFRPNGLWEWEAFERATGKPDGGDGFDKDGKDKRGRMVIYTPSEIEVLPHELWFYNKWTWKQTEEQYKTLRSQLATERKSAMGAAETIRWIKEKGIAKAVNAAVDYLEITSELGLSSQEAKKRVRVALMMSDIMDIAEGVSIHVLDKIRSVPASELKEIAGWFAELPPAEAWSQYNNKYPGEDGTSPFKALVGDVTIHTFRAKDELEADRMIEKAGIKPTVLMRSSSIIKGKDCVHDLSEIEQETDGEE